MTTEAPTKIATVFVRLDPTLEEGGRVLSFDRPGDIPISDVLEAGMAVDGHSIAFGVQADGRDDFGIVAGHPFGGDHDTTWSVVRNLAEAQSGLQDWLKERGYEVEFR